jgi:hypothetical protein
MPQKVHGLISLLPLPQKGGFAIERFGVPSPNSQTRPPSFLSFALSLQNLQSPSRTWIL